MRSLVLLLLVALPGLGSLTRIRDRNLAVQQAQAAYQRGHFAEAARQYQVAVDKLGGQDEALLLNMGHAYARAGQGAQARAAYGRLLDSKTAAVRSVARQQLAVLAAQKGDYAQAVGLLRQALVADPTNGQARYNYEVLRDFLTRRRPSPQLPPPAGQPDNKQASKQENQPQPQSRPGTDSRGQVNDPTQPEDPRQAPQQRPDPAGAGNPQQPQPGTNPTPGPNFQPGPGNSQRVAQGAQPGSTRGLDTSNGADAATGGRSREPGTEPASLNETQLQTQRERLQQMNLSPGQARQVLDALRTAEEQYLQQLPRRAGPKPDPKKPTW